MIDIQEPETMPFFTCQSGQTYFQKAWFVLGKQIRLSLNIQDHTIKMIDDTPFKYHYRKYLMRYIHTCKRCCGLVQIVSQEVIAHICIMVHMLYRPINSSV